MQSTFSFFLSHASNGENVSVLSLECIKEINITFEISWWPWNSRSRKQISNITRKKESLFKSVFENGGAWPRLPQAVRWRQTWRASFYYMFLYFFPFVFYINLEWNHTIAKYSFYNIIVRISILIKIVKWSSFNNGNKSFISQFKTTIYIFHEYMLLLLITKPKIVK